VIPDRKIPKIVTSRTEMIVDEIDESASVNPRYKYSLIDSVVARKLCQSRRVANERTYIDRGSITRGDDRGLISSPDEISRWPSDTRCPVVDGGN